MSNLKSTFLEGKSYNKEVTDKVIRYIDDNESIVSEYFIACKNAFKYPNYSEFCRKYLVGTISEGVGFDSTLIARSLVTKHLRDLYSVWLSSLA